MVTYLNLCDVLAVKRKPLYCHMHGLLQTATGYGRKLATEFQVQLTDRKWRRVYVCQISNAGTTYVLVRGEWRVISDYSGIAELLQASLPG